MEDAHMFGPPIAKPSGAVVFHTVWSYTVKHDGRKKARTCCNGYVLRQKGLKYAQQYYADCIYQMGMNIFFAYIVIKGWLVISGDAVNAYAQVLVPKDVTKYVVVDQHMKDWWNDKYGMDITVGLDRHIMKALQGHP
jgi:hypothetical protein